MIARPKQLCVASAAHDAGGASAIAPILLELRSRFGAKLHASVSGPAKTAFERMGLEWIDLGGTLPAIELTRNISKLLRSVEPDVVLIGTSMGGTAEKPMIREARSLGVPSIGVLDAWVNYAARFREPGSQHWRDNIPDELLVMDDVAAQEAMADGIPAEVVRVTGHPGHDRLFRAADRFRQRSPRSPKRVVFFSEPLSRYRHLGLERGFSEMHAFSLLVAAAQSLSVSEQPTIVVRPHPAEPPTVWPERLAAMGMSVEIAQDGDPTVVLEGADLILGVSTIVLFEAFLLGVPFASLQDDSLLDDPFVLTRYGIVERLSTVEAVRHALQHGPPASRTERANKILRWFDGAATERALSRIVQAAKRPIERC